MLPNLCFKKELMPRILSPCAEATQPSNMHQRDSSVEKKNCVVFVGLSFVRAVCWRAGLGISVFVCGNAVLYCCFQMCVVKIW